jgi:hypothetical protein
MHKIIVADPQGNYFEGMEPEIDWKPKSDHIQLYGAPSVEAKNESLRHLRRVQSANIVTRTMIRVVDLLAHSKRNAA